MNPCSRYRTPWRVASTTSGPSPRSRRIRTRSARSSSAATGASKSSSGRSSAAMHSAPTARSISGSGTRDEPREPRPVRRPRDVDPTHRRSVRPVESTPAGALGRSRPGAILTAPIPSPRLGNRSARPHRDRPARRARSHRPATGSSRHARRGPAPAGRRRIGRPVHGPASHPPRRTARARAARSASTTSSTSSTPATSTGCSAARSWSTSCSSSRRTGWPTTGTRRASCSTTTGSYGPTLTIEDSTRVDPWIVRQAERTAAGAQERLRAFSRLDRATGE